MVLRDSVFPQEIISPSYHLPFWQFPDKNSFVFSYCFGHHSLWPLLHLRIMSLSFFEQFQSSYINNPTSSPRLKCAPFSVNIKDILNALYEEAYAAFIVSSYLCWLLLWPMRPSSLIMNIFQSISFQKLTTRNLDLKVWHKIQICNQRFTKWKIICNKKNGTEQYWLKCITHLMSFHVPTNALSWKLECPLSSTLKPFCLFD